MKKHQLLKPSVLVIVSLLHVGLIALAWHRAEPPEPITVDDLTFVDLGTLEGDNQPLADGAPAPLETGKQPAEQQPAPPPTPEPKPEPEPVKPVEKTPPKVNAVVRENVPADVAPQPKPVPEKPPVTPPKPIEPVKPAPIPPKPTAPAETPLKPSNANTSNSNATQSGAAAGAINRQEGGTGGGGSNPNSQNPGNNAGSAGNGKGAHGNGDKPADPNQIVNGGYIALPNIQYPSVSQDEGEEGTVRLSVIVEANGTVSEVTITKSTGHARLDNAAKRAAQRAGYRPKMVNGTPVRTRFNTSYDFKLE